MILFIIGYSIGLNIGLFIGSKVMKDSYKILIDGYKKDVKYWFESYMKLHKDNADMAAMYVKEATKNMFK